MSDGLCLVFMDMNPVVASQLEGQGFEPASQLWPFCVAFACSPQACVGLLQIPVQIGDFKLSLGVKVSVNGCLMSTLCQPQAQ